MDPQTLHAFRLIAETGSISAAADLIGTVQSALSARLRRLEETVGETLFERLPRGMRLTAAGHRLLPYARRLEEVYAEALAAIRNSTETLRGPFRLGSIEIAAATVLSPGLGRLLSRAPEIDLRLSIDVTRRLVEAVSHGDLDAALISSQRTLDRRLVSLPVVRLPLVLMRPVGRAVETLDQAFAFGRGCVCRERLEALLRRRRLEMRVTELGSIEAIAGCVSAGLGLALLPKGIEANREVETDGAEALDLSLIYNREAEGMARALMTCLKI